MGSLFEICLTEVRSCKLLKPMISLDTSLLGSVVTAHELVKSA